MSVYNMLINSLCILLFLLLNLNPSQSVIENDNIIAGLPFCGENNIPIGSNGSKRLILVSTLDGKFSALNMEDGGLETWSITTGPGAMLSSSIHRLELTNNGQWVRMIPSLSGGLYKFNGDFIEAIPITADNLLRSSFKYSDDLVISGGRESRTYGVDLETGRVLYECSLGGCDNYTELDSPGDVVLVQRQTQTVRAVEPRTGIERWNFSVGQHEVKVSPGPMIDCHGTQDPTSDTLLRVIVPEGLVCALSKSQPGRVLWSHKFDSPVVGAWRVGKGQMEAVDLFGGSRPPAGPDEEPLPSSPALYIGMHQKQLYIQESVSMQQKVHELADGFRHHLLAEGSGRYPQIPWNPILVSSTAIGLPSPKTQAITAETDQPAEDNNRGTHLQTTAMSVLYASEYVNGNGFYLYSTAESSRDSTKNATICPVNNTAENTTEEEIPVIDSPDDITFVQNQIFVTSLWFWWKEVFLISVTTAIIVNILIRRRLDHTLSFHPNELDLVKHSLRSYSSRDSGMFDVSAPPLRSSESFESRFLTDFIPVHCLGKGGFGVVFEAKNKIDDCHYAIKRIPLPNSEESREKVMREVKALAKLDHQNIVRYFNAWLECPPPGWQETQDKFWLSNRDCFSSNGEAFTVDLTGQVTPDSEKSFGHVINRNSLKLQPKSLWQPSQDWLSQSSAFPSKVEPPEDDNDSFIVFQSHSKDTSDTVSENNNDIKEIEVEDSRRLDSAITMASDTSVDTNTDVTDVTKSESPKRPNKLALKKSGNTADSLRMYLFIQMQLCKKKSLKDWLKDNIHNRCKPDVISIFDQIVQAVEYVHMQGLIHRDLKPSNIFFSPDDQVKVGDFGLVTAMAEGAVDIWVSVEAELDAWADDKHTARVGTQLYMSPEQVSGKPYSYKVDIYSLGVILFELLVPFNTQMERIHTLTNLRANKYPKDFSSMFPQEYELLKLMLSHQPDERPTTYGIRARPPLESLSPSAAGPLAEWHFELPKRRASSKSSSSHSNSLDS